MVTEKGTIKVSAKIDENVQKEFNGNLLTMGILYTVIGGILLALGFVLYVVYVAMDGESSIGLLPLFLGAVFLCLGIIMLVARSKALKGVHRFENVQEVEFFSDHLIARKYTNGEHVASEKLYYGWLVNVRETQTYIFLCDTKTTAIVVDKRVMQPNELNTVKSLLGRGAAQIVQPQPVQPQQVVESEPTDPFADFGKTPEKGESAAEEAHGKELYDQGEDSQAGGEAPAQGDGEQAEADDGEKGED